MTNNFDSCPQKWSNVEAIGIHQACMFVHQTQSKRTNGYEYPNRKLCGKEPQSFSHCGSFDHLAMLSLNDCIFIFLVYQL